MKTCTKCLIEKELTAFKEDSNYANGRKSQCRSCLNLMNVERNRRKRELAGIPEKFRQPNDLPANHKMCSGCRTIKPYESFGNGRGYAGLTTLCGSCIAKEAWRRRLALYNFTEEQYWELYNKQNGKCAICHQPETYVSKNGDTQRLALDHDHKCCPERATSCGKCIRGLLCQRCNLFLGRVEDSKDLLLSMISYLKVPYSSLHMDLFKWAYKLAPFTPSELLADCFELASDVRALDMRASPYDLAELGYPPVRIETPEGRAEYARQQAAFATRAAPLRRRLVDLCDHLLDW